MDETPSRSQKDSPVLGLPVDDAPVAPPVSGRVAASMRLSVIVPARNEERNLPVCLTSLVAQSEESFALGQQSGS